MRVNVYAEEITPTVEVVRDTGSWFVGLRFILKTHPDQLKSRHPDDDPAAVTFWVKSPSEGFRLGDADSLADLFQNAADSLRSLPSHIGDI